MANMKQHKLGWIGIGRMGSAMAERLAKAGAETRPGSPADFGAFIRDEKTRWAKVVKESGAKFD